jgi:PAP2 superfamily
MPIDQSDLHLLVFGSSAGFAALLILCCDRTADFRQRLFAAAIIPVSFNLVSKFLHFSLIMTATLDPQLMRIDGLLGSPAARVGELFLMVSPLRYACFAAYYVLPLGIAFAAAHELRSGRLMGVGVLPTMQVAGVLGFLFYFLVPAVGPVHYFGSDFPLQLHMASLPAADADFAVAPRNCVPSLHVAWATLAFLAMRGHGSGPRLVSGAFLVLTALATLGLGEHYLIDLVIAAPFVVLVRGVCAVTASSPERRLGMLAGAGLTLSWCAACRYGMPPWAVLALVPASLGTIVVSVLLERRIAASEASATGGTAERAAGGAAPRLRAVFS